MIRVLLIASLLSLPDAFAQGIAPASAVRYATVCGNCHEAECSGRLSFRSGAAAAAEHIRRYVGVVSGRELEELSALLKFTKEHCRIHPTASNSIDGHWDRQALSVWREATTGRYFIPLGNLPRGRHALRIAAAEWSGEWRIVNERWETVAEDDARRGRVSASFDSAGGPHYLHVAGADELDALELVGR